MEITINGKLWGIASFNMSTTSLECKWLKQEFESVVSRILVQCAEALYRIIDEPLKITNILEIYSVCISLASLAVRQLLVFCGS